MQWPRLHGAGALGPQKQGENKSGWFMMLMCGLIVMQQYAITRRNVLTVRANGVSQFRKRRDTPEENGEQLHHLITIKNVLWIFLSVSYYGSYRTFKKVKLRLRDGLV